MPQLVSPPFLRIQHGLRVSGNWRLTFAFIDGDAHIVNLEDYH